jgi:hypothetical protein
MLCHCHHTAAVAAVQLLPLLLPWPTAAGSERTEWVDSKQVREAKMYTWLTIFGCVTEWHNKNYEKKNE